MVFPAGVLIPRALLTVLSYKHPHSCRKREEISKEREK
jgi:hypothetical protein